MTEINRPNARSLQPINKKQSIPQTNTSQTLNIVDEIVKAINGLNEGLKTYPIRDSILLG